MDHTNKQQAPAWVDVDGTATPRPYPLLRESGSFDLLGDTAKKAHRLAMEAYGEQLRLG